MFSAWGPLEKRLTASKEVTKGKLLEKTLEVWMGFQFRYHKSGISTHKNEIQIQNATHACPLDPKSLVVWKKR